MIGLFNYLYLIFVKKIIHPQYSFSRKSKTGFQPASRYIDTLFR